MGNTVALLATSLVVWVASDLGLWGLDLDRVLARRAGLRQQRGSRDLCTWGGLFLIPLFCSRDQSQGFGPRRSVRHNLLICPSGCVVHSTSYQIRN